MLHDVPDDALDLIVQHLHCAELQAALSDSTLPHVFIPHGTRAWGLASWPKTWANFETATVRR
jgi:hypothetical protein